MPVVAETVGVGMAVLACAATREVVAANAAAARRRVVNCIVELVI